MNPFLLGVALAAVAAAPAAHLFELHAESSARAPDAQHWVLTHKSSAGGSGTMETVLLDPEVLLDASAIASADVERGPDASPQIRLVLTRNGAARLSEITSRRVGRRLGIVAGGRLRAAPVLTAPVTDGVLVIAGDLSGSEAEELAHRLGPPAAKVAGDGSVHPDRLAIAGGSPGRASPPELDGAWKVMNSTMNGQLGDQKLTGSTWTFRGGELRVENADGQTGRFAVQAEAGPPPAIRLEPIAPSKERGGWMIYSREGDRLTLAFGDNLTGRPASFAPEAKKVVLKLARADRLPAPPEACAMLEAAGVAKLLPGAAARSDRRRDMASCSFSDPAGREVSLIVFRGVGRPEFDKEAEKIRMSPGTVRDDPELGPSAVSVRQGYRVRYTVLQRETLVELVYQLPGTDDARLREFTKRLLGLLRG
jgi:uncharacterized protein (TIGR03067 family)